VLTDYLEQAMRKAHYELMENGRYYGSIPVCPGVWAQGKTLEACREELHSTLEDWLLLGLQMGDKLPVVAGIDLNPPAQARRTKRQPVHA
jgi:predicted RNase H-like HicB family nuclease